MLFNNRVGKITSKGVDPARYRTQAQRAAFCGFDAEIGPIKSG